MELFVEGDADYWGMVRPSRQDVVPQEKMGLNGGGIGH